MLSTVPRCVCMPGVMCLRARVESFCANTNEILIVLHNFGYIYIVVVLYFTGVPQI